MTSILVSSDDDELCQNVGSSVAEALGYNFVGEGLLEKVAERYGVKLSDLRRLLDPSARRWSAKMRPLLLTYIQTLTLERLVEDNVVCGGLAAQLYVKDISHVLTVRVLSDSRARATALVASRAISPAKAASVLLQERTRRSRWSLDSFGVDDEDPSIYDIVLTMGSIELDKVVDIIKDMASYRKFQPMTYSRKCLGDLALASQVRATLLPRYPDIRVSADGDTAIVHVKCSKRSMTNTAMAIKEAAEQIPEVAVAEVHPVSTARELERLGR